MPDKKSDTPLLWFFLLAFGLSWILWIPAAFLDPASAEPVVFILYLIGGFGPSVAGLLMIGRTMDKAGQQDVFQRLLDFHRIGWRRFSFIIAIFPLLGWFSVQVYRLVTGSHPDLPALQGFSGKPGDFVALVFIAIQVLLMGPLAEELGWRGFALDRLSSRWNILFAGLILGVIWGLWHLPLFFISGSMYAGWGFGTGLFWLFLLRMTALSILISRVYEWTTRSILSAVLMHFMFNFTYGFFQPSPAEIHLYGTLIITLLAAGSWLTWRQRSS